DIPLSEVRRVVEAVGLGDALARLDGDLQAKIQVGGPPLSRSEALRLCLARALLGGPRLLVIDEALDGLDPPTREQILALLLAESATFSVLLIACAPAVIERCDRAFALVDGALRPLTA